MLLLMALQDLARLSEMHYALLQQLAFLDLAQSPICNRRVFSLRCRPGFGRTNQLNCAPAVLVAPWVLWFYCLGPIARDVAT